MTTRADELKNIVDGVKEGLIETCNYLTDEEIEKIANESATTYGVSVVDFAQDSTKLHYQYFIRQITSLNSEKKRIEVRKIRKEVTDRIEDGISKLRDALKLMTENKLYMGFEQETIEIMLKTYDFSSGIQGALEDAQHESECEHEDRHNEGHD